jgi:hypothetical protein
MGRDFPGRLLELFLKDGQSVPQVSEFGAKGGDLVFQASEALGFQSSGGRFACGGGTERRGLRRGFVNIAGEKMDEAGFLGAWLAREDFDERGLALHEEIESGVYSVEIVELVEALGASAELAGGLRAAEKEDAEEGYFVAVEIEDVLEAVLELGYATVGGGGTGETLVVQRVENLANGGFIEIHDRVAIRFLVAGVDDGVEGQRVILGSGDLFFEERAEDTRFRGSEMECHGDR